MESAYLPPVAIGYESEAAAGSGHGRYLAGQGIIIPPESIHVDSSIASIDYNYPVPETGYGLTIYSGHSRIPVSGQEELIQIGIQGGRMEFDDLPPINVAFVTDRSGSIAGQDKMEWVKESFYLFVESVRDIDFVSLVVFDNTVDVIFPSTRMDSQENRLRFKEAVRNINTGGGINLVEGLEKGYGQMKANYRAEYTNRVLFLTDGVGGSAGLLDMASTFREMGVNVSSIGLGADFDLEMMNDLARTGGGSSRLVANQEEMHKIFGTELDRVFVPVARDMKVILELGEGVSLLETWGYSPSLSGNTVTYSLPTLWRL